MGKFKPSMLGDIHALKIIRPFPTQSILGKIGGVSDISGGDVSGNQPIDLSGGDLSGGVVFAYTYIIYGVFEEGESPNWYWCDEFQNTENPPVLAEGYDGTTALRDGLAVVVSGTFYQ
jgi:hypothetical protein